MGVSGNLWIVLKDVKTLVVYDVECGVHSLSHCTVREVVFTVYMNFSCVLVALANYGSGSDGKESTCNAEDLGPIPGLGRSPGGGNGNPL